MSTREPVVLDKTPKPLDVAIPQPRTLTFPVEKVTEDEVNQAAESAGLLKLDARSIRSCRVLGAYVDQEGALAVGSGIYWVTAHNLTKAIAVCGNLIEHPPTIDKDAGETPAGVITDLMKAMAELSGQMIKAAGGIAQMAKLQGEVAAQNAPPPVSPFGKGQMVVPINAGHVTINQPSKSDE